MIAAGIFDIRENEIKGIRKIQHSQSAKYVSFAADFPHQILIYENQHCPSVLTPRARIDACVRHIHPCNLGLRHSHHIFLV
jgi:hypothetical protein